MEALSDFGGFNDGVLIIPAIFMQIYSSRMYLQSLFALLPVKQTKISGDRKKMKDKLDQDSSPFELTETGKMRFSVIFKDFSQRSKVWHFSPKLGFSGKTGYIAPLLLILAK